MENSCAKLNSGTLLNVAPSNNTQISRLIIEFLVISILNFIILTCYETPIP